MLQNTSIVHALSHFFSLVFTPLEVPTFYLRRRIDDDNGRIDGYFTPTYDSQYPTFPTFSFTTFPLVHLCSLRLLDVDFFCVHTPVRELYC